MKAKMSQKQFTFGLVAAVASAIVTSGAMLIPACCAGPMLFAALGVGAASLSSFESFFSYRWLLYGITLLFIATAFQQTYFRSMNCATEGSHAKVLQTRKILFWIAMIFILILILVPIIR
jgi:hypothetical protein